MHGPMNDKFERQKKKLTSPLKYLITQRKGMRTMKKYNFVLTVQPFVL